MYAKALRCYCDGVKIDKDSCTFVKLEKPHDPRVEHNCEWPFYVHDVGNYCDDCEWSHEWSECHPYGETVACEQLWECDQPDLTACPYFIDQMNSDEDE